MGLRDDILTDAENSWFDLDNLAQEVIYKIGGSGDGETIRALIQYGGNLVEEERYYKEAMTAVIQAADIGAPAEGDTITVDSDTWTVRRIISGNGFHWQLECDKGIFASV